MIKFTDPKKVSEDLLAVGCSMPKLDENDVGYFYDILTLMDRKTLTDHLITSQNFSHDCDALKHYTNLFYNRDNKPVIEYSLSTPKSDKISVGTIFFAINHTEEDVRIGMYHDIEMILPPNRMIFLNLGLSGISFELDETSLLQGVIHSSIDEIDYFSGDKTLRQGKMTNQTPKEGSMLVDVFDAGNWVHNGFAVNHISKQDADALLELVKQEHFQSVAQVDIDLPIGYSDRFISKHSMYKPQEIKPQFQKLLNDINELACEILENKTNPAGHNLSVFSATTGHYMDLHTDCADGSPLISILYLNDNEFEDEDGGQISSVFTKFNELGSIEATEMLVKTPPKHGLIVQANNSNPHFAHEVHKILSDKFRYSIIINSAMLTNPKWHVEFEEKAGFYDTNTEILDLPN